VVGENSPSDHETYIHLMPSRNPCRLYIHLAFTCSGGPTSVVWKRTRTGSAFSTNESAWSVNGHGLSVSCVKWPYSEANCAPYSYCSPDHRILFQSTTTWCTIFDILPNCHFLCPTLESRNSVHPSWVPENQCQDLQFLSHIFVMSCTLILWKPS
jgi:hypothetical protein